MLSEVKSDAGNITKTLLKNRIKEIKNDLEFDDELKILLEYEKLIKKQTELKKQFKSIDDELNKSLLEKYKELTEDIVKELVIKEKWLTAISNSINDAIEKTSQNTSRRIRELADRYEIPLPELVNDVQLLKEKVDEHLESMGFKWK